MNPEELKNLEILLKTRRQSVWPYIVLLIVIGVASVGGYRYWKERYQNPRLPFEIPFTIKSSKVVTATNDQEGAKHHVLLELENHEATRSNVKLIIETDPNATYRYIPPGHSYSGVYVESTAVYDWSQGRNVWISKDIGFRHRIPMSDTEKHMLVVSPEIRRVKENGAEVLYMITEKSNVVWVKME
jgi:hypothetical protein